MTASAKCFLCLGKVFDPRMYLGFQALINAGGDGRRDVLAIDLAGGEISPSQVHTPLVEANWCKLQVLLRHNSTLSVRPIKTWSDDRRRIGSRSAAAVFNSLADFIGYTDVIIDISALPRSIYFPLIAKALYLLDETTLCSMERKPNLHILVSENPVLDTRIRDEDIDETATYVHPFSGGLDREATAGQPKIWIPILGEGQKTQLDRIYDLIDVPDEICPVLPFPSLDPRRSDNLVLEYRDFLFDRLRIEPRNFIYASERNPFEVYRQIRRTILHYREVLQPLGECKTVLSALSTKLLSVGALLVAYELKQAKVDVGVAHVGSQGYIMDDDPGDQGSQMQSELFGLWLAGECYES